MVHYPVHIYKVVHFGPVMDHIVNSIKIDISTFGPRDHVDHVICETFYSIRIYPCGRLPLILIRCDFQPAILSMINLIRLASELVRPIK